MRIILNPDVDHTRSPVSSGTLGVDQVTLSADDWVWCAECTKRAIAENPYNDSKHHKVSELHHYSTATSNYIICPLYGIAIMMEMMRE